jgi:hypothetical protein
MTTEIKSFVKSLFEASSLEADDLEWPEDFDSIDAVALVRAIAGGAKKSTAQQILANPYAADAERINALLDKYAEARPKVTGEVLDDAFKALQLSFDYGVMGAEPFCPKVFVNGGLLLRNHHRVVAIDSRPTDVIRVSRETLRAQLADIAKTLGKDEGAVPSFFILHRDEEKDSPLTRTQKVPDVLNGYGQTLVFLGGKVDPFVIPCLGDTKVKQGMQESRTGFVALQVYRDMTFLYGMYRASDEYDVLLEEYALHALNTMDDPVDLKVGPEYTQKDETRNRTKVFVEQTDLAYQRDGSVLSHYLGHIIHNMSNRNSYASKKLRDIRRITPRFAPRGDEPVRAFENQPDYSVLRGALAERLVVLELTQSSFTSIGEFEKNFQDWIGSTAKEKFGPNLLATELLVVSPEDFDVGQRAQHLVPLGSPEAKKHLREIAQPLHKDLRKAIQEDQKSRQTRSKQEIEKDDVLGNADFMLQVVLQFKEMPLPSDVNDFGVAFSAEKKADLQVVIPALGFQESYSQGLEDDGNAEKFIPEAD